MLRFYDLDFNLLGEIDQFISLQFNRSWYGCGDVELHLNRYTLLNSRPKVYLWDKVFETITDEAKELVIMLDNNPKKVAIIHTDSCSFNDKGKGSETLVLKGKELKYLTHRAVTYPQIGKNTYEITASVETIMKTLIGFNQGNSAASIRQLPNFAIETDLNRGSVVYWNTLYQPLDTELESIAIANNCGWWYEFDPLNKVITAKFGLGIDRTQGSNICVLKQNDSLMSGNYFHSDIAYYNAIIAEGKGVNDTVTTVVKSYGSASGLQRKELYKKFDAQIPINGDFTNLDNAVSQYLASCNQTLYIEGNTLLSCPNKYGINYDVGDLITLQMFDLVDNVRITNIKEIIEAGKPRGIELTFGQPFPTMPNLIYKEFNGIKRVI